MAFGRGLMIGLAGAGQGILSASKTLKEYKLKEMDKENDRLADERAHNSRMTVMKEKFNLGKEDRLVARHGVLQDELNTVTVKMNEMHRKGTDVLQDGTTPTQAFKDLENQYRSLSKSSQAIAEALADINTGKGDLPEGTPSSDSGKSEVKIVSDPLKVVEEDVKVIKKIVPVPFQESSKRESRESAVIDENVEAGQNASTSGVAESVGTMYEQTLIPLSNFEGIMSVKTQPGTLEAGGPLNLSPTRIELPAGSPPMTWDAQERAQRQLFKEAQGGYTSDALNILRDEAQQLTREQAALLPSDKAEQRAGRPIVPEDSGIMDRAEVITEETEIIPAAGEALTFTGEYTDEGVSIYTGDDGGRHTELSVSIAYNPKTMELVEEEDWDDTTRFANIPTLSSWYEDIEEGDSSYSGPATVLGVREAWRKFVEHLGTEYELKDSFNTMKKAVAEAEKKSQRIDR